MEEKKFEEGVVDVEGEVKPTGLAKPDQNGQDDFLPPAIGDDKILAALEKAERRIEAVKKTKAVALKICNENDFVDENGKPYLQASGAEKIARLFGISWRTNSPVLEFEPDGHFRYVYRGEFISESGAFIEVVGARSSRDGFFSKRGKYEKGERTGTVDIKPEEIDKADVMKAAYSNLVANGVTRLLGIRNLTWEELEKVGIARPKNSITYDKSRKAGVTPVSEEDKKLQDEITAMLTEVFPNDPAAISEEIKKASRFMTDTGEEKYRESVTDLKAGWLKTTHRKIKNSYNAYKKSGGASPADESSY